MANITDSPLLNKRFNKKLMVIFPYTNDITTQSASEKKMNSEPRIYSSPRRRPGPIHKANDDWYGPVDSGLRRNDEK